MKILEEKGLKFTVDPRFFVKRLLKISTKNLSIKSFHNLVPLDFPRIFPTSKKENSTTFSIKNSLKTAKFLFN
jgi:hypothetical protein